MAELRTLLKKDEKVRLYAISIDDHVKSKELKEKIASDGKGEVSFPLLADPGSRTVEAYGLRDRRYEGQAYGDIKLEGIPIPAVYVVGRDGRVAWASIDEDYKKRPSNAEIRTALDALKK